MFGLNDRNTGLALLALAAIVIFGIALRSLLLKSGSLYDYDSYFYYAAIKQAAVTGAYPYTVNLSGFPFHYGTNEAPGLVYIALLPYLLLAPLGVNLFTVVQLVPLLFGLLDIVGAYVLAKQLVKSRIFALMVALLTAVSFANISKTAATVYRGDVFITIFALAALIFAAKVITTQKRRFALIYALLAALVISISPFIWNGGYFVYYLFLIVLAAIALYAFIYGDKRVLGKSLFLSLSVLAGTALYYAYSAVPQVSLYEKLSTFHVPLTDTLSSLGVLAVAGGTVLLYALIASGLFNSMRRRIVIMSFCIVLLSLVVTSLFWSQIAALVSGYVPVGQTSTLGVTAEELLAPSPLFLWNAYGAEILLAPLGIALFAVFAIIKKYSTFHVEIDSDRKVAYLLLICYSIVTGYLALTQERYASLFSVPVAIFAGYMLYEMYLTAKRRSVAGAGVFSLHNLFIAAFVIVIAYQAYGCYSNYQNQSYVSGQELQAAAWLASNTPSNATILTLWQDGSVVEGWGNRQSYTDSVGGENGTRIANFSRFLLGNKSSYLAAYAHKPNYLFLNYAWLYNYLGGIAEEGGLNASEYAYEPLPSIMQHSYINGTIYTMSDGINILKVSMQNQTGTVKESASVGTYGGGLYPLAHLLIVNLKTQNYTFINSSASGVQNDTAVLIYLNGTLFSVALANQTFANTEFFKYMFECSYNYCSTGSNSISAKLVYANIYAKTIKLNYS